MGTDGFIKISTPQPTSNNAKRRQCGKGKERNGANRDSDPSLLLCIIALMCAAMSQHDLVLERYKSARTTME